MGEQTLDMEGTLATIMDTLHCADIPIALSIITTLSCIMLLSTAKGGLGKREEGDLRVVEQGG